MKTGRRWARQLRIIVPAAVILIGALVWLWYPHPSDQELILAVLQRAEHGIETKDTSELLSCISPDYRDPEGLTRTDVLRLAIQWARQAEQAEVTLQDRRIGVQPPAATADLEVALTLSGQGRAGSPANMHLRAAFQKERRGWRSV